LSKAEVAQVCGVAQELGSASAGYLSDAVRTINKTSKEIWQAVEARDGQRELTGRQLQREEERMMLARKKDLQTKTTLKTEQQQRAPSATKRVRFEVSE
jgi:hypothetical protein